MVKARIFVVEDESIISNDIQQSLKSMGYEVAGSASSGEVALKEIEAVRPDIVLMDIMLAGKMDGIEAAEHIFSNFYIPVIYITAYADEKIIERAKLTEPFGYIIKPFEDRELHFAIQMGLYKNSMQSKIRKQNEFVNTIMESLTHPFYIIDASNYNVVMANKAAGFGSITQGAKCYALTHHSDRPCSEGGHPCPIDEVKRTGRAVVMEHVHYDDDNVARTFEIHAYPVFDSNGTVVQIIEYSIDITDRKALERQLSKSQKLESIGRMAGGVAHDFSNIMSAVLGYSEMAMMELPEDHPVREKLSIIRDAGEKAAMLTRQLLAFSSRQILEIKPVNISLIVDEMVKMLVRIIGEDVLLDINTNNSAWNAIADRSQVEQILLNLAVNARDAMPCGGTLRVRTADVTFKSVDSLPNPDLAPGDYVQLTVSDTGEGMTQEVQDRIFEPFFTTKQEGRGTGLGLSTVYGIIKQHKGTIIVNSAPGKGSAFTIYLPAVRSAADVAPMVTAASTLEKGTETILVVDDEPSIRNLLRDILRPLGYVVLEAPDGDTALTLVKNHQGMIDLLLTDVVMPRVNGVQLAKKARKLKPGMKVLYMSGYWKHVDDADSELNEKTLLQKPIRPSILASRIRDILGPS